MNPRDMPDSEMNVFVKEVFETDAAQAFSALHHLPYSIFFDSADLKHTAARYSFIVCQPLETLEVKDGRVFISGAKGPKECNDDPFKVLKERIKTHGLSSSSLPHLPPFQGGAAGFFGYDLGRSIEILPEQAKKNGNMPDMAVGIYDQVLAFDHLQQKTWLITHARSPAEAEKRQRDLWSLLSDADKNQPDFEPMDLPWEPNFDAFTYRAAVKRVVEYIHAGDIFQANLSQRFDAELPEKFCPYRHYRTLRKVNPAPFAGFMNAGYVKISSASPERFLTVENGHVETRPIKGTRPRNDDPTLDKVYRTELENSEKDRAENTMIVDLLRNDLSRVCEAESVEVTGLCKLESFAGVHHLVSTICGKLRQNETAVDLLKACFPGGSITGAPKIRAMEIIEELEPTRRGPYSGALAYIGSDGNMDSNILIRTLVYENNKVSFQTGGGIVADSDPDQEYQETFYKADPLFRSFENGLQEIDEDYLAVIGAE